MAKFYFTYGSDTDYQPFNGGWTEVKAETMEQAVEAFCIIHPRKNKVIPCAMIYSEEVWKTTKMGMTGKNFGVGLRETIELKVKVINSK